jgi:ubiquinone/menaquinone biosynthesis C-methylase UbiE
MPDLTRDFGGSIPEYYDRCLGPAWFDPFGRSIAARLPRRPGGDVLEIACGTGLVTRHLRERIDSMRRVVATDLSKPMVDFARGKLAHLDAIEWREADAANLPFADGAFGAVVCAFGLMFVPDRQRALREAHRVLTSDGILLFSVWDRRENNAHAVAMAEMAETLFPGDPEMRYDLPYDMNDADLLRNILSEAGFHHVRIETERLAVDNVSARSVATGQIRGTPRSALIEKRGVSLAEAEEKLAAILSRIGGADPFRATVQAIFVEARASK